LADADQLLIIATGVVLPTDIAKCLVKEQMSRRRLNSNEISFWQPLPSLKIQTFDLAVKKVAVKAADAKIFTIGGDRDLSGRLFVAAKVQNLDIKEVQSYELAVVPIPLAHLDGSLHKTSKSFLFSILEADKVLEPRLPIRPGMPVVHLSDGMALS